MFSFICSTVIIRVSTFLFHIINYVLYTEIRMFYKINIIGRGLIAAYASIGIRLRILLCNEDTALCSALMSFMFC